MYSFLLSETIFVQAKRDTVAFYDLPGSLNNMLPVRPSCFNQIFLDNSGGRAYIVTSARVVRGMVQGKNQGKKLGIVRGGGDNTQPLAERKRINHTKCSTGNLP